MERTESVVKVALIVQDFLKNEARTLEISKGKMLSDKKVAAISSRHLKVV